MLCVSADEDGDDTDTGEETYPPIGGADKPDEISASIPDMINL